MRIVSIALLGAAVGLHTAIFTAVDLVLLRPLPFPDPDRLVVVSERKLTSDTDELSTLGNYRDIERSTPPFAAVGAYASSDPVLFAGEGPRSLEADGVSVTAARDALTQRIASLEQAARQNQGFRAAAVVPLRQRLVAGVRAPILALGCSRSSSSSSPPRT
jgi:hypothetical protein